MRSLFIYVMVAQIGLVHAIGYQKGHKKIDCLELDSIKTQKLLNELYDFPPETLLFTNIDESDFIILFDEILNQRYANYMVPIKGQNAFFVYNLKQDIMSDQPSIFKFASPVLSSDSQSYIYDESAAEIFYCVEGSAGVSSKVDTNGNKQIQIDFKTNSDDKKLTFMTGVSYEENSKGQKSGSAQVEARFNFGGSKNNEK